MNALGVTTIDAHQHAWEPERVAYPWLGARFAPIDRAMTFDELEPQLVECGIDRTVMVQSADSPEDSAYMIAVADGNPKVAGVVAWIPLAEPDLTGPAVAALRRHEKFVGMRHLIQEEPDDWLLRDDVNEGLGVLEDLDVPMDVVAFSTRHIDNVIDVGGHHPRLRMVIDHLAKPPFDRGGWREWQRRLAAAAENPNVYAKISGLYPVGLVDRRADAENQLARAVDFAVDTFGPQRLMYGGDWPISVLFGGYLPIWLSVSRVLSRYDAHARADILGRTATQFYRLPPERLARE